ncbi:MAG: protein kinase domain-containing protein, partial [Natronosporangium sp.]
MSGQTLLTVLRAIIDGSAGADQDQAEAELLGWSSHTFSRVLLDLPVDRKSFLGRFERSWDTAIDDLGRWCTGFRSRPQPYQQRFEPVFGYLGLLLVTLVSLRQADEQRYRRLPDGSGAAGFSTRPGHDCRTLCAGMLAQAPVRAAIRAVYAPDAFPVLELAGTPLDRSSRQEWDRIDFDTLRFHRHGTTSFILTGLPADAVQGQRRPLALKCIVYPYLRVPSVVRATREYLARYGTQRADVEHVAGVWASSHSWILMDYVDGETLAEHLDRRLGIAGREVAGRPAARLRIDLLAELGRELFSAMADLDRAGLRHHDLSPSNIIVQRRADPDRVRFVLVDLGVNHLYTHAMPGLDAPDSVFVAPEIRAGDEGARTSDLYSIGQLLIAFSGGPDPADGLVPDRFYAETPVLARFVEDLIGREQEHRLLIFTPDPDRPLYPQLRTVFDEELTAMAASRAAGVPYAGPGRRRG